MSAFAGVKRKGHRGATRKGSFRDFLEAMGAKPGMAGDKVVKMPT